MAMSDICPCNTWSSALTVQDQTQTSQTKTQKLQAAVWNFNDGGNNMQRLLMVKFQEGGMGLKFPLRSSVVHSWVSDRASEGLFVCNLGTFSTWANPAAVNKPVFLCVLWENPKTPPRH